MREQVARLFACGLMCAMASGLLAQEETTEAGKVLGQPAGWSVAEETALVSVSGGSELFEEPSAAAPRVALLPESQLELIESRGSWVRVRYGDRVGWVDLDRAPAGDLPPPTVESRVRALKADPERLARAQAHLGEPRHTGQLGPFVLHTDVDDAHLLERLGKLAEPLADLFGERYGVIPVEAEQRGEVVLYAGWRAYDAFNSGEDDDWIDRLASGHSVPGMAVFHAADEDENELLSILVHELTHLLTWQTFGVDLPWWLKEGMAEDMAMSRWRRGRLEVEPLGRENLRFGLTLGEMIGAVLDARKSGRVPGLDTVLRTPPPQNALDPHLYYAQVGFWVRFLLQDDTLGPAFRAYLAGVASGESPDVETLFAHLGPEEDVLNEFDGWMLRSRKYFSSSKLVIQHERPISN